MTDIGYVHYLELWRRHPREHRYGYGQAPEPMTRARWEEYGKSMREVEVNVLEHQNRMMDQAAARAARDVPATTPELAW